MAVVGKADTDFMVRSQSSPPLPFWEDPSRVESFATRDADLRLLDMLDRTDDLRELRVLDLGCAGGRNTVVLAERGCDVWALDGSAAMVAKTRERVAQILGDSEAQNRVMKGSMDNLSMFGDGTFDLVVALGIYQSATSVSEWDCALAETSRVLVPGGEVLVAVFDPGSDLTGEGVTPVPGEPNLYTGLPSGRGLLVDSETLELEMSKVGLETSAPSRTVATQMKNGHRVVVNAQFRKELRST